MPKRKFLYSESKLSEVTGLSRAVLKGCRIKGEWKSGKGKGRPVVLSELAVRKVLEKFGIKDTNLDGARAGLGRNTQPALNQERKPITVGSEPVTIHVVPDLKLLHVSQLVPNKRILRAKNGTGEVYQVIVPTSLVWAVGDPLRAKPSEKHHGYYELVGPSPRNRGDRYYRLTFV